MAPTRLRTLLLSALACGVAAWLVLRLEYANLPPLPWSAVPALLILAVCETGTGWLLRARLRRRRGRPVPAIAVARVAALAKASSLAAALFSGLAAGSLAYVAGSLGKSSYQSDAYAAAGTLASAVALTLAALYLEHGCRVPPGPGGTGPGPRARLRLPPAHLSRSPTTKNSDPTTGARSATRWPGSTSGSTATLLNDADRSFSRQGVLPPRDTR
jgi:hypothetical protein